MSSIGNVKPLYCNKCGASGFFHSNQDIGNWPRIDRMGNIEAFDPAYRVPHWYVCSASTRGKENRKKLDAKRQQTELSNSNNNNAGPQLGSVYPSTGAAWDSRPDDIPKDYPPPADDIVLEAIRVDLAEVKATLATILERLDTLAYPQPPEPENP